MDKKDILNYVINSPENTNYSVLNSMLDQFGGGENPNYTQIVTGTLTETWGEVAYSELSTALATGNATGILNFNASAIGFESSYTQPLHGTGSHIISMGSDINLNSSLCNLLDWNTDGTFNSGFVEADGTISDLTEYASLISTTVTIYWHPMPAE